MTLGSVFFKGKCMFAITGLLIVVGMMPPRLPPLPPQPAEPTIARLEAQIRDLNTIVREQNRLLFRLGVVAEDSLGRIEKLEKLQRPRGYRYTEEEQRFDGTIIPGRWEFFLRTDQRPNSLQPNDVLRFVPPRQTCDEADFSPGGWEVFRPARK